VVEPQFPNQNIIPLLVQEKLMVPPQRGINLTVLIEVRRMEPAAIFVEAEQYHALADVEKDANVITTPVQRVSIV